MTFLPNHQSADAIIVGGGIVGCAAAYYLAKEGARVILLERAGIGAGASGRSGGGVRQSARASAELQLANETVALFQSLADELGVDIEYTQRGNLRLVESVDHIRPMQVDVTRQQSYGLDVRWLGQAETCELVPSLRRESVLGASYCPTDGHANPLKVVTAFAHGARNFGAQLVTNCAVQNIRQNDAGAQIETTRGTFHAREVLIAAGAGTRALCLNFGVDLPLANMRYESLVTEALPPMFPYMFGVAAADLFFRQTRHGSVHFGGGMVQPSESQETTEKNLQLAAEHIVHLIPALAQVNLVRTWGGLDPSTPDGIPIIDRVNENVLVATGFCGHGFALGPIVGRYLAQWIALGEKPEAFAAFRRNRFDAWLQTKWTPTGSFEAMLATETTQLAGNGHGAPIEISAPQPESEEGVGDPLLYINPEVCTGCRMCEMACSIHHNHLAQNTQLRIKVAYIDDHHFTPIPCIHCPEQHCMNACMFDALVPDGASGAIRVVDENCTACMLCVPACPYGGITFSEDKNVVIKCDLCDGDPACAQYCPTGAIRFRPLSENMMQLIKENAEANVGYLEEGLK